MKKILLIIMVSLAFMPSVSADLGDTSLDYTSSIVCASGSTCYPVYHITSSGKETFFVNNTLNFNLKFNEYYEVDITETTLPKEVLEYAAVISFMKKEDIYYKEVMQQKLWELVYNIPFEIKKPNNTEVIKQMNDFEYILNKVRTGPSFANKTYSITSSEILILEDSYLYLFSVSDIGPLKIESEDTKLKISGPPGEYNIKLVTDNKFIGTPKIYTDGENYLITEGSISNEYNLKVLIDMRKVTMTFEDLSLKEVNIYHEDSLYKTITLDETGIIDTYLPIGEISLIDSSGKMLKNFNVTEDTNINIPKIIPAFTPEKESDRISDTIVTMVNTIKDTIANNTLPNKEEIITLEQNEKEVVVLLPDTLCM